MINHSHVSVWLWLQIIKFIQHYTYASHCLHFPHFYLRSEPFQTKERKIITQSSFYQTMAAAIQSVLLKRATSHFLSCSIAFSSATQLPQVPPFDHQPNPYKGPSAKEVFTKHKTFLAPSLFHFYQKPVSTFHYLLFF